MHAGTGRPCRRDTCLCLGTKRNLQRGALRRGTRRERQRRTGHPRRRTRGSRRGDGRGGDGPRGGGGPTNSAPWSATKPRADRCGGANGVRCSRPRTIRRRTRGGTAFRRSGAPRWPWGARTARPFPPQLVGGRRVRSRSPRSCRPLPCRSAGRQVLRS